MQGLQHCLFLYFCKCNLRNLACTSTTIGSDHTQYQFKAVKLIRAFVWTTDDKSKNGILTAYYSSRSNTTPGPPGAKIPFGTIHSNNHQLNKTHRGRYATMSSVVKKPSPSKSANLKPPAMPNPPRSPLLRGPSSTTVTANGVARSQSNRGTSTSRPSREALKRPSPNTSFLNTNLDVSDEATEEDARAENISIVGELRDKMRKAETASEEYQRQLNMIQTRLDDSLFQQGKLEDQVAEVTGTIEELENEKSRESRLKREMESNFDAERSAFVKDKNEQKAKEEELELVIQRLKENLSQRDLRSGVDDENGLSRPRKFLYASARKIEFLTLFKPLFTVNHRWIYRMTNLLRLLCYLVLIRRATQAQQCRKIKSSNPFDSS